MTNKPHWILEPENSSSREFRDDCTAWHIYTMMPPEDRKQFIKERPPLQTPEFTNRLQRSEAWWWLSYLTRYQIEENLRLLSCQEESVMRAHLNTMRVEMKKFRQKQHKTFMPDPRGNSHA